MRVLYHPEFVQDVVRFSQQYSAISPRLEVRFRVAVDDALLRIKSDPTAAGHFLKTNSKIVTDVRRRNLDSFPYFVLYAALDELIIFGSLIPSASDPLTWLDRFSKPIANTP